MNRTPLLRPLRDNGATLYVFPSASEDIGLNLDSRSTSVALSHYALLNLPETPFDNEGWATQLQNYVMNFETLLLNNKNYNYQEYHTVTERVFFHWLTNEDIFGNKKLNLIDEETDFYYIEDSSKYADKTRLIQCFGSIDAGNSLSTEFGMFNETYLNIPTSYGNGPVIFSHVQDPSESNYILGKKYKDTSDTLQGRDNDIINSLKILKDTTPKYDEQASETEGSVNCYKATDAFEIVKDPVLIQKAINKILKKQHNESTDGEYQEKLLNSYDDINVDISEQFKDTMFDITSQPCEFNFNAILLYYSVYDQTDPTKAPYAINLFGIIFLDGTQSIGSGSDGSESTTTYKIQGLTKRKSYSSYNASNFFGNSYSFRINVKTLSVYDNTDAVIQDNTTMSSISSVDFSDVISNLNRAIDTMNTNVQTTMAIQDQYMQILRYYDDQKTIIDDISTKVNGFINGSATSSFNSNLIRTNEIRPLLQEPDPAKGQDIRIQLTRCSTDYTDAMAGELTKYIPPIIITNTYEAANIPMVFKPLIDVNTYDDETGIWTNSMEKISDIIDNLEIKYYTIENVVHQYIDIPKTLVESYGLKNLQKDFDVNLEEQDTSKYKVNYINYDTLIPLILSYIKQLKTEIETLKNNNS